MSPLAIYLSVVIVVLLLGIAVRIWKYAPTRMCHLCNARVEIGRRRCQVCGYEFVN